MPNLTLEQAKELFGSRLSICDNSFCVEDSGPRAKKSGITFVIPKDFEVTQRADGFPINPTLFKDWVPGSSDLEVNWNGQPSFLLGNLLSDNDEDNIRFKLVNPPANRHILVAVSWNYGASGNNQAQAEKAEAIVFKKVNNVDGETGTDYWVLKQPKTNRVAIETDLASQVAKTRLAEKRSVMAGLELVKAELEALQKKYPKYPVNQIDLYEKNFHFGPKQLDYNQASLAFVQEETRRTGEWIQYDQDLKKLQTKYKRFVSFTDSQLKKLNWSVHFGSTSFLVNKTTFPYSAYGIEAYLEMLDSHLK